MRHELTDSIIFQKYHLYEPLSKGSFGQIYLGQNVITKEYVAIKTEEKAESKRSLLQFEYQTLLKLRHEAVPKALFYGDDTTHYYLVEELLGLSLEDLFSSCGNQFSLKTVTYLAIEILKVISFIHSEGFVHCDIKPANFMFGLNGKRNQLYLIDYGLSNQFRNEDNTHAEFTTENSLTGTARYCSVNSHLGYQQSRRDDLESIGYMLIYFVNGCLPWQGLKLNKAEKWYKTIERKKMETDGRELCRGLPAQFEEYLRYVRGLEFAAEPDYDYLIQLFKTVIQVNGYSYKSFSEFDWDIKESLNGSVMSHRNSFSLQRKDSLVNSQVEGGVDVEKVMQSFSESRPSNASKTFTVKQNKTKPKRSEGNCQCLVF